MQQMININTLSPKITEAQKNAESMNNQVKSCTVCLGASGGGKSSLISYLCGAHMTCEVSPETGDYELSNNNKELPVIGHSGTSCTTIPKIFKLNETCVFYDSPGFLDSQGIEQEILNAFSNARMFKLGMKAKICIVVDQPSLKSGRGVLLIDVIKRLVQLFDQNFSNIMNSCILVVSKVNTHQHKPIHILYQVKQIKNAIEKNSQSRQLSKQEHLCLKLIELLVDKNRIIIFPEPESITPEVLGLISKQIQLTVPFQIENPPTIAVSNEAKATLEDLVRSLVHQLEVIVSRIGDHHLVTVMGNQYSKDELKEGIRKMVNIKTMLRSKQLRDGQPSKIEELQNGLNISHQHLSTMKKIMSHFNFCRTIVEHIKSPGIMAEGLLKSATQAETHLNGLLTKLCQEEEIQELHRQHQIQMRIRQKQHQKQQREVNERRIAEAQRLHEEVVKANRQKVELLEEKYRVAQRKYEIQENKAWYKPWTWND